MKFKKKQKNSILDDAYRRYYSNQSITYEEYVIMLATNDELWFWHNNTEYQVVYNIPGFTTMYVTKYDGEKKLSEYSENYKSIIDMLENFTIDGRRIRDIWSEVSF
ncbi:MAG: hypothetical protein IJV96_01350 [Clostridia bacterium]|nr:hypothetical protein [Clostridia bacterium]